MGSDYDPHQFGMVKLGSTAGSDGDEGTDAATPEDILFEEGPASEPAAATETDAFEEKEDEDDGWGTLAEAAGHVGSAAAFPAPTPPATASKTPSSQSGRRSAEPMETPLELEPAAEPVRQRPRPAESAKGSGVRARLTSRPPRIPAHRMARPPRPSGWLVPIVVFTLSAGVGAVMFLFFQNLPLAGLAWAMGLIGSLFTRILLR